MFTTNVKLKTEVELFKKDSTTTLMRRIDSDTGEHTKVLQIVSVKNSPESVDEYITEELFLEYEIENNTSKANGYGGLVSLEFCIDRLKGVEEETKDILKTFLNKEESCVSINREPKQLDIIADNKELQLKIAEYLIGKEEDSKENYKASGLVTDGSKFIVYGVKGSNGGEKEFTTTVKNVSAIGENDVWVGNTNQTLNVLDFLGFMDEVESGEI